MPLQVLDHPLAAHLLSELRNNETSPELFRRHAKSITTLLILQATTTMTLRSHEIVTPVSKCLGQVLDQGVAVVPVLRAGLGMLEPALELFPDVAVGYIGLERHEGTAVARSYYSKLPNLSDRFTICVDPMLATGGSASQAVSLIKARGATKIVLVTIVSAPEGVKRMMADHPEVMIVTAALDDGLNAKKYIVPGLGDAGDRLFGTFGEGP